MRTNRASNKGKVLSAIAAILFAYLLPVTTLADETGSRLAQSANAHYEAGEYKEAIGAYQLAIEGGLDNGHLFYNLANAYYRQGYIGHAIAAYRKALALLPGDPDVLANLSLARKKSVDKIEHPSRGWFQWKQLLDASFAHLTEFRGKVLFLISYLIFWLCIVAAPVVPHGALRYVHRASLLGSILFAVLVFGTRPGRLGQRETALLPESRSLGTAVIVSPEAKVYSGNSETYQVVFVLHDGAEIETKERREGWIEILLPGSRRGWVQTEDIDLLS